MPLSISFTEMTGSNQNSLPPFFVLHYKGNTDRRAYLRRAFASASMKPIFIKDMDRDEFRPENIYRFDPAAYANVMLHIKDNIVGTVMGLHNPTMRHLPWAQCISLVEKRQLSLTDAYRLVPELRPHPPNPGELSLILKHRIAYQRIIDGGFDYGIIAEDDVVFNAQSDQRLGEVLSALPADFDYVDLAGGIGLMPRTGNPRINRHFYQIIPPRPRTTCCAIVHRSLAERFMQINPPFVVGIDWMLIYVFRLMNAKVFWVEPRVFGHGSQEGQYRSNLKPRNGSRIWREYRSGAWKTSRKRSRKRV